MLPAFLVFSSLILPSASPADCLTYAGRVRLEGVLLQRTYPGPPNYESVETGDAPETAWLMKLSRATCVLADAVDNEGINAGAEHVPEVQLVLAPEQFARAKGRIGKRTAVSGSLFGAHTAHHRTPVLLDDVEFEG